VRLLRVGAAGSERPAAYDAQGVLRDLSSVTKDIDGAFLESGGVARAMRALGDGGLPAIAEPGRIGAPVARPWACICVGHNYRAHIAETGAKVPVQPVLFLKASNCVIGPTDTVRIPRGSVKTDYEIELTAVIGKRAHYLADEQAAAGVVAGYCIGNDVSERQWQSENSGGQFMKGKSAPTFAPLGPWLVTADEVPDPQVLSLKSWVNGDLRQSASTADMLFGVFHIVWFISQHLALEPGDVVMTGTPAGVALGRADGRFLRDGDVVEMEIERLGRQRTVLAQA